jgi:hypothetical protein
LKSGFASRVVDAVRVSLPLHVLAPPEPCPELELDAAAEEPTREPPAPELEAAPEIAIPERAPQPRRRAAGNESLRMRR